MTDIKLRATPWRADEHCTYRVMAGAPDEPRYRACFIEKTPRVQVPYSMISEVRTQPQWSQGTFLLNRAECKAYLEPYTQTWWYSGPKGDGGPFPEGGRLYGWYPASRQWCDDTLLALGYTFEAPEIPATVASWLEDFRQEAATCGPTRLCHLFVQLGVADPSNPEGAFCWGDDVALWFELHQRYYNTVVLDEINRLGARDALRAILRRDARYVPSARHRALIEATYPFGDAAARHMRNYGKIADRDYARELSTNLLRASPNPSWVYAHHQLAHELEG